MRRRPLPGFRTQIRVDRAWKQKKKTGGEGVKRGAIGHKDAMVKTEAVTHVCYSPFINILIESYFA